MSCISILLCFLRIYNEKAPARSCIRQLELGTLLYLVVSFILYSGKLILLFSLFYYFVLVGTLSRLYVQCRRLEKFLSGMKRTIYENLVDKKRELCYYYFSCTEENTGPQTFFTPFSETVIVAYN